MFERIVRCTIVAGVCLIGVCLIGGLLLGDLTSASARFLAAQPSSIETRVVPSEPAVSAERVDRVDEDADASVPPAATLRSHTSTPGELAANSRNAELVSVATLSQPTLPVAGNVVADAVLSTAAGEDNIEISDDAMTRDQVALAAVESSQGADASDDPNPGDVELVGTLDAKKDLPASINALAIMNSQSSIMPARCEDGTCTKPLKSLGTSLQWAETPADAYRAAGEQDKLVFLIHVSGNFEIPGFT